MTLPDNWKCAAIILRSDLRCPKNCDGRIIESRAPKKGPEYRCDRCKTIVNPLPRGNYVTHARK